MFVSPGAYAREIDLSLYTETVTNTSCAMVILANKGVLDTPTLITSLESLKSIFGTPIDSDTFSQGWLACREYLRRGNKLYAVRVDASGVNVATVAGMSLPSYSDDTLATANDGATSIPATRTLTSAGSSFITAGVVIGDCLELADVSSPADNGFYIVTNVAATILTVDRNWPTGSLTGVTFTVWSGKKEEGTDGVTSVPTTRTLTSVGSTFVTNGVAIGDMVRIYDSVDTGDNGLYRVTNVAATILTVDRDFKVGSLTGLSFTVYSNNSNGVDGSTATAGEFLSAGAQFALHGVKAGDVLVICDAIDTANNGTYLITGLKAGLTATTLTVNNATWIGGVLTGLSYYVLPGSIKLEGESKGTWCAGFGLYPTVCPADSLNVDVSLYNGTSLLEKAYNLDRASIVAGFASDPYLRATLITGRGEPCPGFGIVNSTLGIYLTISGGNNGTTSIADSDYISGINMFSNPEQYLIDIIACPGVTTENVHNALAALVETRQDCVAICDPPDWATLDSVQEILDWHNGIGGTVLGATARGSSYCCTYWAWQKVYDEYNAVDRWTAPSGHMAAEFAHNDNQMFPWFAPAGLQRGKIIGSSDVRYSPSQNDRDSMLSSGQAVNPISSFVGSGIYVFGQKTLYRANTALNRLNVRRMLNYCKRIIVTAARQLAFEPNDDVMWRQLKLIADAPLRYVLTNRGIREYLIIADSTTTTATELENYKMVGKLIIKPMTTAEIIELQFALTSQGSDFSEFITK